MELGPKQASRMMIAIHVRGEVQRARRKKVQASGYVSSLPSGRAADRQCRQEHCMQVLAASLRIHESLNKMFTK